MSVTVIFLCIVLVLIFSLIIFGFLVQSKLPRIFIPSGNGQTNRTCLREKTACDTDSDCANVCSEGEEVVCMKMPDIPELTDTQKKLLNATGNGSVKPSGYCVKAPSSKLQCNESTGGIPIFTGWGNSERMEFDCMCSYPLWASARSCDQNGNCTGTCQLNPGICEGGVFHWDLKVKAEEPVAGLCECKQGDVMVVDPAGLPRCVPEEFQTFYADLDTLTGNRGSQDIVLTDHVQSDAVKSGITPQNCVDPLGKTSYTSCPDGCCYLANAVCCGDGTCCPKGYECNKDSKTCIKSNTTCNSNETKCAGGCLPIVNGTCCQDLGGISGCPPNFPICDVKKDNTGKPLVPIQGVCNPLALKLVDGKAFGFPKCGEKFCPIAGGYCAGDGTHCCPPEYPIFVKETLSCRQV